MENKLIIVIGAFGSGKSEYSVNLAQELNKNHNNVVLADMDVVNPYFRSRDVREEFELQGITVIAPDGQFKHADLPMISPRIRGAIQDKSKNVILDVGGDPMGCRTLGRFHNDINLRGYELQLVINTNRPFTSNPNDILVMMDMLQKTSGLKVTEFICNSNLMQFTDTEVVDTGISIVQEVSELTGIPFRKFLVLEDFAHLVPDNLQNKERHILHYYLKKPWDTLVMKGI
ncbi:MAG: hypothetical protein JXR56_07475 [Candidatus Cloacimonetes bacterium]|nr:hypothetical protein [Candidatus Cloacimonadota bacterium]